MSSGVCNCEDSGQFSLFIRPENIDQKWVNSLQNGVMKQMTRIFLILGLGTKGHTNLYFDARFCRPFHVKHSTIVKCGVQVITHVWCSHFCTLNLDDAVRVYSYTEVHWRVTYKIIKQFVGNKAKGQTSKRVFQRRGGGRGKKCSFFGKFGVLCFLEIPILTFALLPYYRQIFD